MTQARAPSPCHETIARSRSGVCAWTGAAGTMASAVRPRGACTAATEGSPRSTFTGTAAPVGWVSARRPPTGSSAITPDGCARARSGSGTDPWARGGIGVTRTSTVRCTAGAPTASPAAGLASRARPGSPLRRTGCPLGATDAVSGAASPSSGSRGLIGVVDGAGAEVAGAGAVAASGTGGGGASVEPSDAGDGGGCGAGWGTVAGVGGVVTAPRSGISESGSTYPSGCVAMRTPRCTYGRPHSGAPLVPARATGCPSLTSSPFRTRVSPRWVSVTE